MERMKGIGPRSLLLAAAVMAVLLASESVVLATRVNRTAGPIKSVKAAVGNSVFTAPNTDFGDVTEVTTTISVPEGENAIFLITFTANYWCYDSHAYEIGNWMCLIKATVDGADADPATYQLTGLADIYPDSRTFEWVAGPFKGGNHTVRVQARGQNSSIDFHFNDRMLKIERAKV